MTPEKVPEQFPNIFLDTLRELRGGMTLEELSAQLQSLVAAVQDTGKKGALVFTLNLKPASAGSTAQLIVSDDIKAKVPILDRGSDVFFAVKGGRLTRDNPNQRSLNLKIVSDAPSQLKEIANG